MDPAEATRYWLCSRKITVCIYLQCLCDECKYFRMIAKQFINYQVDERTCAIVNKFGISTEVVKYLG